MSIKTILVIVLALSFGGSAALVVILFAPKGNAQTGPETGPVVVAAMDVGRGTTISKEMVQIKQWPKTMIGAGVCTKLEDVVGRASRNTIVKDEPIVLAKLSEGTGLQSLVPAGMRAYTIQTPSVSSGVGGFIQPDDRVDVILTVTSTFAGEERRTGGGISTVLLQNIQVLAAGPSLEANSETNKVEGRQLNSVTLLVTARQAQELTLAQSKGQLNLALRRDGDSGDEATSPLYLSDLPFLRETPNDDEGPAVVVEPPKPEVVEPVVVAKEPTSQIRTYRGLASGLVIIQNSKRTQ